MDKIPDEKLYAQAQDIDRRLNGIRHRLHKTISREYAKGQLTGPQRAVMQVLVKGTPLKVNEVAKAVGLSQSTVSGIVERLVERGMISRKKNPKDKRAAILTPSKEVQVFLRDRMPNLVLTPLIDSLAKGNESEHAKIFEGLKTLETLMTRAGHY